MLRDPTRFALRLGNYRAVFVLVNGPHVVDTIDRVLSGRDPEPLIQRFWQVECGGREFLVGYDPEYKPIKLLDPHLQGWSFAIEVGSAEAILEQLVNAVKPAFPGLALPILPRIAMSVDPPSSFLLSPDGYAMIRRSAAWVVSEVEWKADFGLVRRAVAARLL